MAGRPGLLILPAHAEPPVTLSPPLRIAATLLAMLSATTILSQFFRSSLNVIAPELIRDLALSPEALGLANSAFFLALLAIQVPVGILFDRIGVRLTVAGLALLSVAGALMHAIIETGAGLTLARFLLGLGHGGSFMSTIVLCSHWYPRERWSTVMSWVFALSMLGVVLAGTPLALAQRARRLAHGLRWRGRPVGVDRPPVLSLGARRSAGSWRARRDEPKAHTKLWQASCTSFGFPASCVCLVCRQSPMPSWPVSWGYGPDPTCTTCTASMRWRGATS